MRLSSNEMRIPNHESANCKIVTNGTLVSLISYTTDVCGYDTETGTMYCNGTYSPTTRRHISWFATYIKNKYKINCNYYTFERLIGE